MSITEQLKSLATVDLFKDAIVPDAFVGRPFYFDFSHMKLLSNDHWKEKVGGIAAGAFLVAVYDRAGANPEVVLLRVLGPTTLPSDSDVVAAMVDHYKENAASDTSANKLDSYTRYEFQFSGLECRVLGSFYRDAAGKTRFGADVDNFYGPNNYSVYRPTGPVLEYIVNFRDGESVPGCRSPHGAATSGHRALGTRRVPSRATRASPSCGRRRSAASRTPRLTARVHSSAGRPHRRGRLRSTRARRRRRCHRAASKGAASPRVATPPEKGKAVLIDPTLVQRPK